MQVPSYISRSVAGSYDNEAVAIFALIFTFYLYIKVLYEETELYFILNSLVLLQRFLKKLLGIIRMDYHLHPIVCDLNILYELSACGWESLKLSLFYVKFLSS